MVRIVVNVVSQVYSQISHDIPPNTCVNTVIHHVLFVAMFTIEVHSVFVTNAVANQINAAKVVITEYWRIRMHSYLILS